MKQTISFSCPNEDLDRWVAHPEPAIQHIPEWYRTMNKYQDDQSRLELFGVKKNLSVKACVPFLDSLTAGYYMRLSGDVLVRQTEEGPYLQWTAQEDLVTTHDRWQLGSMGLPSGVSQIPFKWTSFHNIKTPKGWSCLITHPMQRTDLPFVTMSGVVDTDSWRLPINLPFFMSDSFEGKIERGTPIAQIIPIRRADWTSEYVGVDKDFAGEDRRFFSYVEKYYRRFFWQRKSYK